MTMALAFLKQNWLRCFLISLVRKSIGLTNIHKRLMAIYGPDNGLHIDSTYGTGTTVSFKIPKQEED